MKIIKITSPLSQDLWPLNLAGRWLQRRGSEFKYHSLYRLLFLFSFFVAVFGLTGKRFLPYLSSFVTQDAWGQEWAAFIESTGTFFCKGYFYREISFV